MAGLVPGLSHGCPVHGKYSPGLIVGWATAASPLPTRRAGSFTVALAERSSDLLVRHIDRLRRAYKSVQDKYPFESVAACVLTDHLHAVWTLPSGDERSASKIVKGEKGIWQRRYWEHSIRDDADLGCHVDYIHFNPVKHRYVSRVSN